MTGFPNKEVIAELTAKMLIEVEAVRFMTDKPFIFTSGWASPVYTDCRRLISFPRVRRTLVDFGVATIEREIGFEQFDGVAGGETAGIMQATNSPAMTRASKIAIGRNSAAEAPLSVPATTRIVKQRRSAPAGRPHEYTRLPPCAIRSCRSSPRTRRDVRPQIAWTW